MGVIGRLIYPKREKKQYPRQPLYTKDSDGNLTSYRFDVTAGIPLRRPALFAADHKGRPLIGAHVMGVGAPNYLGLEKIGFFKEFIRVFQ